MINYKVNSQFQRNLGFDISHKEILLAVSGVNTFLCTLPPNLYRSIDFKTTGAMIGAIFCTKIIEFVPHTVVNPIENGHPDIIPISGVDASEKDLRNYPKGMEIKGTIGSLKKDSNLRAGETRINSLTGITWQAHHQEVKYLLGFVWDFVNEIEEFNYPAITGVFFSDELNTTDWGKISGTEGRNTKVAPMNTSGKDKMGQGVIILYDNESHIQKYSKLLNIPSFD